MQQLSPPSDFVNFLHSFLCLQPQVAAIFDWNISAFLYLESRVNVEFLARSLSIRLGPSCLSWIFLVFELLVTLRTTKLECLAIISDKLDTVARVQWPRAKTAPIHAHITMDRGVKLI